MAAASRRRHNRGMMNKQTDTNATSQQRKGASITITELRSQIDQRDETIRLLNEALSRALDELTELDRAA
jgi:hypothetical protein